MKEVEIEISYKETCPYCHTTWIRDLVPPKHDEITTCGCGNSYKLIATPKCTCPSCTGKEYST